MIAITGATGQLGHYVIESPVKLVPASQQWLSFVIRQKPGPWQHKALPCVRLTTAMKPHRHLHFREWKNYC